MRTRLFLTILLFMLVLCASRSVAQSYRITGQISDSITGKPLAFVSLVVNDSRQGGLSDIDGKFDFTVTRKPVFLRLSYLGYRGDSIHLSGSFTALHLLLSPIRYELSEVVILPGENPALRIVRKVVEHAKENDPASIASYACQSYNKITAEWRPNESYYTALAKLPADSNALDSGLIRLVNGSDKQHLLMMESFTRRIYRHPGQHREDVLATRVSGFRDPNFAPLATDLQPFSFYGEMIDLNTGTVTGYQNPFGKGGLPRYSYLLEDTLYDGADSIFVISFRPAKGRSFNALEGVAYVHSQGWALQNVMAGPADGQLWQIRIQQQYRRVNDSTWFPEQLNYDWVLPKYPNEKVGVLIQGRSYIDSVKLNIPLRASDFGPDQVTLDRSAAHRDSLYWAEHRSDTLDARGWRTYRVMDSLGRKYKLDYYTRAAPAILDGFLPVGPLDLSLDKLYTYNDQEGHRIGLGLRTGEKISRRFHIGGYIAYGFKDKILKYGSDLLIRIWPKHDLEVFALYMLDLEMPGRSTLYGNRYSSYWYGLSGERFDMTEVFGGGLRLRTLRYLETELSLKRSEINPCYPYAYLHEPGNSDPALTDTSFIFTEAAIGLRYTVKDQLTQAFGRRISSGSHYPTLYFTYTRGISGLWGGHYEYDKIEGGIRQNFRIRNFGKTSLLVEAGQLWGDVPYMRLFRSRGTRSSDLSFLLQNSFQTMRPDEFVSDRYISLFFSHNFGNFLFKAGKFKPEFILSNNLIYGDLSHADHHRIDGLQAPAKGYFEAGLVIDNLIRVKLLNVAYLGLGAGAYYRYGSYRFTNELKNFAFKVSFRISGM